MQYKILANRFENIVSLKSIWPCQLLTGIEGSQKHHITTCSKVLLFLVTFLMSSSDSPFITLLSFGVADSDPVAPGPELA